VDWPKLFAARMNNRKSTSFFMLHERKPMFLMILSDDIPGPKNLRAAVGLTRTSALTR
jgi:hypothetical protein